MRRINIYALRAVKDYMQTHNGWRTASKIRENTGVTAIEMRQLCQVYTQTFISCGEGYKLTGAATNEEVENSLRILMSRADKILHRARSLQRFQLERNKANRRVINRAVQCLR